MQLRNLTNQILLVGMRIVEFQVPVAEVYVNRLVYTIYSKYKLFWLAACVCVYVCVYVSFSVGARSQRAGIGALLYTKNCHALHGAIKERRFN